MGGRGAPRPDRRPRGGPRTVATHPVPLGDPQEVGVAVHAVAEGVVEGRGRVVDVAQRVEARVVLADYSIVSLAGQSGVSFTYATVTPLYSSSAT